MVFDSPAAVHVLVWSFEQDAGDVFSLHDDRMSCTLFLYSPIFLCTPVNTTEQPEVRTAAVHSIDVAQ